MSTVNKRRSPVFRQLEAYHESWQRDHDQAMACMDWEDAIAVGISIFRMLRDREQAWRDRVFRGAVPFTEEDNLEYRSRFAGWLQTTKEVLAESVPGMEEEFNGVGGADSLRECVEQAEKILREWQPARLSTAVGLREMTLSAEAAAELERILAEAKTSPPDLPPGPRVREISAAEYLRRKRQRRDLV